LDAAYSTTNRITNHTLGDPPSASNDELVRGSLWILKLGRMQSNNFDRRPKSWNISPLIIATAVFRSPSLLSQKHCIVRLLRRCLRSSARKIESIVLRLPGLPNSHSRGEQERSHESHPPSPLDPFTCISFSRSPRGPVRNIVVKHLSSFLFIQFLRS
jgi:hypothetical protein